MRWNSGADHWWPMPRLHIGFDELVAGARAIGFALALLVGDGDIVLGLPRRRDAQIEGGTQRTVICGLLRSRAVLKQLGFARFAVSRFAGTTTTRTPSRSAKA